MNDLTAFLVFGACLLATFGLVHLCMWLLPATSHPQPDQLSPKGDRP